MNTYKIGLSTGFTGFIIYLICFILMSILPKDSIISLANLIFHGIDFTSIIRMDIPFIETIMGLLLSFFVWGGIGFIFSTLYNKFQK